MLRLVEPHPRSSPMAGDSKGGGSDDVRDLANSQTGEVFPRLRRRVSGRDLPQLRLSPNLGLESTASVRTCWTGGPKY